ncbi:hypothetical protein [Nocardia sp. 348MFTsu5.1]|nr:hypothetical protein [Nocardia sp. 348MFTsu5.1]
MRPPSHRWWSAAPSWVRRVLTGPGQARAELGLQKVDGQWLISRISDF